jgi:Flp pilus assembly protein TadG
VIDVKTNTIVRQMANQRGASMIMVAVAIVVIFAFAVAAIDLALIMLAKTQLQNAADAAAIAGALTFSLSSGDTDAAVAEAIRVAGLNIAIQQGEAPVVIGPADVTFPEPDRIRVTTHRTLSTGDALTIYFLKVLDPVANNLADVTARASASVFPLSGTDCLKPWCVPDMWDDTDSDSAWDEGELYDPDVTGYKVPDDIGTVVTFKLANPQESPRMGWFYAIDFGPINTGDPVITGADAYREWIADCEPYIVAVGDQLQVEPGNMVGPTAQGVADLMNADPNAEWDPTTGTIINSAYLVSPRVIRMTAFDPTLGVQSGQGRDFVTVSKIMVMFLEGCSNKEVTGRFMRRMADGEICPECPEGFLFKAALVE